MRISDWSSDVCSSDLHPRLAQQQYADREHHQGGDLGVGERRDVDLGTTYLPEQLEADLQLDQQPLGEVGLVDRLAGTDRVEDQPLARLGDQVALARGPGRAERVRHGMPTTGQLPAQLNLKGMSAVVVDEDLRWFWVSGRSADGPLDLVVDPRIGLRQAVSQSDRRRPAVGLLDLGVVAVATAHTLRSVELVVALALDASDVLDDVDQLVDADQLVGTEDRKSTRLNSSH